MDLTDTPTLRALLERHGLKARKGLGQHFLVSKSAVRSIVSRVVGFGGVLEIGPGPGVLTGPLSQVAEKVIALEVDARIIDAVHESAPSAEVIEGDGLETDLSMFLDRLPSPRAVVSNLPYYITGPLITRIAEERLRYDKAVLMMQREVAMRVLAEARNSERGSLSVFLQVQFDIQKVADVPAGAFWPPPKVNSVVLEFVPKETGLSVSDEASFFEMIRGAFRQPRKTLANNLIALGFAREIIEHALREAKLEERCRPSDPDLDQWRALFRALKAS